MNPILSSSAASPQTPTKNPEPLLEAAKKLEAAFLAEMLQSAGLGKTSEAFGGGIGEDQFSSFLVEEQARQIVETGGIGLAQSLFEAMKEASHEQP